MKPGPASHSTHMRVALQSLQQASAQLRRGDALDWVTDTLRAALGHGMTAWLRQNGHSVRTSNGWSDVTAAFRRESPPELEKRVSDAAKQVLFLYLALNGNPEDSGTTRSPVELLGDAYACVEKVCNALSGIEASLGEDATNPDGQ